MKSTLIVATLLAAALTSASALPTFAAPNNGAFQGSAEGNKPKNNLCEGYRQSFLDMMHNAETATSDSIREGYVRDAISYHKEAKAIGCGWVKTGAQNGPWIGRMS